MKKILLLIFLVSSVVSVNAITKKIEGFIIKGKSREAVTFDVPYYTSSIDHVKAKRGLVYYKSGKKKKLKPKDADKVELNIGDSIVTLVSKELRTILGKKTYFLRPYIDGKLSYYILELSREQYGATSGNAVSAGLVHYIEKKGVGTKVKSLNNVQKFISDCPYVMEKLNGKNWWRTDFTFQELFIMYNQNCDK